MPLHQGCEALSALHFLWLAPLAMLLWRFQGGAWFAAKLPGRPVWYVIPILAGCAWLIHGGWQAPAAAGLGLLFASLLPHGRWYTLEHLPRTATGRAPSWLERLIEALCDTKSGNGRDDALCLLAVKAIAFWPLAIAGLADGPPFPFAAIGLLAPLIILAGYAIGWALYEAGRTKAPTAFGEYAAGLAIALLLLGLD